MALSFATNCLPLAPGALPHPSAAAALAVLLRYTPAVLAWPQLPRRAGVEEPYLQAAVGFPGLVRGSRPLPYLDRSEAEQGLERIGLAYLQNDLGRAALGSDVAAGLAELLRLDGNLGRVQALKGQLLGPVSTALQLIDEQQRPLAYDPLLCEALAHFLRLRAAWQESRLADLERPTLISIDEPYLDTLDSPFAPLESEEAWGLIDEVLAGISQGRMLYIGSARWLPAATTRTVDVIGLSVYENEAALLAVAEPLAAFLERGGILAYGIVPVSDDPGPLLAVDELAARLLELFNQLEQRGLNGERLRNQALLMPAAALTNLTPAHAERSLALLAALSDYLRQDFGL